MANGLSRTAYNPYGATLGALSDIGDTISQGIQDYTKRKQQERDYELRLKGLELPQAQLQAQTDVSLARIGAQEAQQTRAARQREIDLATQAEQDRLTAEDRRKRLELQARALPTAQEKEIIGGGQYIEELTGASERPEVFEPWAERVFGDLRFGRNTRAEWNKIYTNVVTNSSQKKDFDRRQQILKGLRTEFDDDLKTLSYNSGTGFAGAPPTDPSINELRARVAPYGEVKVNVMRIPFSTDPLEKPVPEWVGEMTPEQYQEYISGGAINLEGGAISLAEDEGRLVFDYDIDINPALQSARGHTPYTEFEREFDTPDGFGLREEPIIAGDDEQAIDVVPTLPPVEALPTAKERLREKVTARRRKVTGPVVEAIGKPFKKLATDIGKERIRKRREEISRAFERDTGRQLELIEISLDESQEIMDYISQLPSNTQLVNSRNEITTVGQLKAGNK